MTDSTRPAPRRTARPTLLAGAVLTGAVLVAGAGGAVAGTVITGAQVKDGSLTGIDLKNGSVSQGDLTTGTVASLKKVRAWAHVAADGTLLASSGGVKVTKSSDLAGTYCLSVSGVDGRKTAPAATLDFSSSDTVLSANEEQAFVEVGRYQDSCGTTQVVVNTMVRTYSVVNNDLTGTFLDRRDQAFYVVVP